MKHIILAALLAVVVCGCGKKEAPTALPDDAKAQACALGLDRINHAKEIWAEKLNRSAEDTPTMDDLEPYLRHPPTCPSGGIYTLGKVSEKPTCSIPEHQAAFEKKLKEDAAAPAQ